MPWCSDCDRFYNPNTLDEAGSCPQGHGVELDVATDGPVRVSRLAAAREAGVPWHFWLMVAALVAYLGWRLVAGIIWVVEQLL